MEKTAKQIFGHRSWSRQPRYAGFSYKLVASKKNILAEQAYSWGMREKYLQGLCFSNLF
jgi:hypothetical protein